MFRESFYQSHNLLSTNKLTLAVLIQSQEQGKVIAKYH